MTVSPTTLAGSSLPLVSGAPLLRVESLTRVFDVSRPWLNRVIENEPRRLLTAAADISFEIAKGETFAIVGESGSGKSTVAKLIVGHHRRARLA
jgi:peptide/nickel transport system ATP-binding protein